MVPPVIWSPATDTNVLYCSLVYIQKISKNLNEESQLTIVTLKMQPCDTVIKLVAMMITSHTHFCFD